MKTAEVRSRLNARLTTVDKIVTDWSPMHMCKDMMYFKMALPHSNLAMYISLMAGRSFKILTKIKQSDRSVSW